MSEDASARPATCTIAVMQPYLFPYVGYYQLAAAVDRFVLLDDVSYIKQGWINRNRLLLAGQPKWITLPVAGAGSHVRICDVLVDKRRYTHWRRKFLASVTQDYGKAAFFPQVFPMLERVLPPLCCESMSAASVAAKALQCVLAYLDVPFDPCRASQLPIPVQARGTQRVLEICKQLGAARYLNLPGGTALYDPGEFGRQGVHLRFVFPGARSLAAAMTTDGSQLSFLHVLMHHAPETARELLADCEIRAS
jgi:hypothetical protein